MADVIISNETEYRLIQDREVVNLVINQGMSEDAMLKQDYDSDNDRVVDNAYNAIKLGLRPADDYVTNDKTIDLGTF